MNKILSLVLALFCLNGFSQGFKSFYSPLNTGYFMGAVNHPDLSTTVATETEAWGAGGKEILLFKLDEDDDIVWQKCYGDTGSNAVMAMDTIAGDNYILGGSTADASQSGVVLLRLDHEGDTVWTKILSTPEADACVDVKKYDASSFVMLGYTWNAVNELKTLVSKLDNNGTLQWSYTFENVFGLEPWKLCVQDGYIYLLTFRHSSFDPGLYIIKLDAMGQIVWQYRYTKPGYSMRGMSIFAGSASGIVISGYLAGIDIYDFKAFYTRLDTSGNIVWAKQFMDNLDPIHVFPMDASPDLAGNILTIGEYSYATQGMFCAKIDYADGNILWRHGYTPGGLSRGNLALSKPSSTLWIGSATNSSTGIVSPVLLRTDVDGYNPCNHTLPNLMYGPMSLDRSADSIYISPLVFTEAPSGFSIGYPVLHDSVFCSTVGLTEINEMDCLEMYPNPANDHISISSCEGLKQIDVYDAAGRCVYSRKENGLNVQVDLSGFLKGIYCLRVETEKGKMSKKIMVE